MTTSTRDRLLDAAQRLFAEQGFAGTSVGDIEEEAGFARRGGTAYKHFASKEAVLEAVVDRHAASVAGAGGLEALLPLGDLRAELTLLARFVLAELGAERQVHQALDGARGRYPAVADRMLDEVVEPGYRRTVEAFAHWVGADGDQRGLPATVTVLLGGLANARRNAWTFGRVPLDVADDDVVAAWVDVAEAEVRRRRGAM